MEGVLRIAGPSDAAAIRDLTRQAYAKWIERIGREPLPMGVDYAEAVLQHRFDLLEAAGQLAGLVETAPSDRSLLVVNLAIAPDMQGRGLGSRLLKHAEDLAVVAGLDGVRLYTHQRFEENLRFYAARGYGVDREETISGGVVVHLSKPGPGSPV